MKKVLCYIDMLGRGGAQRVMSNLVGYFHKRGYEVVLVNDFIRDDSLPHYDVPAEVKREYLRKKRKGLPVIKNLERVFKLFRVIKKYNPDIAISFLGGPNTTMLLAGLFLKTPLVVSVRNDPNREYGASGIKRRFFSKLFARANGVVFQTEDASKYFSESIKKHSKIILNPVDREMYSDKDEYTRHNIVTFGRLQEQKNHIMLIDAFSRIAKDYEAENLYIYGDGPLRETVQEYINKVGLKDRVFLPGNISNVKEELCKAKIFVLSSDYEGLPNALMEAMATATPSISTDCPCGGPRTLIQNEEQGCLIPIGDSEALANAMKMLLDNDDKRQKMGVEARKRADEFCDVTVYSQWEKYILEIAENKK